MAFDNNMQKKCGFCGETIPANTSRCPYCGSVLEISFDSSYSMDNNSSKQDKPDNLQADQNTDGNAYNAEARDMTDRHENPSVNENINYGRENSRQYAFQSRIQSDTNQYGNQENPNENRYGYGPDNRYGNYARNPLSNGMKVFLTVIFTLIPGIGQLAGIITAIIFMNTEGDSDRRSFGIAILVVSLIMFVLSCIGCFITVLTISSSQITY